MSQNNDYSYITTLNSAELDRFLEKDDLTFEEYEIATKHKQQLKAQSNDN